MKKYILLALLALAPAAFAQVSTQGTDFYLSFGKIYSYGSNDLVFQIRIVATEAATVTLTFKANTALNDVFTVNAGEVYTYPLTSDQKASVFSNTTTTSPSNNSLRIQSTAPVSVYALNQRSSMTDATNVLPVGNLGTDYYQVSYKAMSGQSDGYIVIATANNTKVYEDGALMATLDAGEVYSAYYKDADATGRHIAASTPIAYFVTNSCVFIPAETRACDCLYQQMVPVNAWGNNFLVPVTRRGKERVRVVASQGNTTVTQTGGTKKTDGGGGAQDPRMRRSSP
jgi:hypothetical protein